MHDNHIGLRKWEKKKNRKEKKKRNGIRVDGEKNKKGTGTDGW